ALPLEVPLETIFDGKAPGKAVALAAGKDVLAMATSEGGLVLLDPATATIRQRVNVAGVSGLAFAPDGSLYALTKESVVCINAQDGSTQPVQTPGIGSASAIAIDPDGNIVLADVGPDSQVKAFSPDGKLVYTCGKQGGRPIRGDFDPQAMMRMSSVAVDDKGQIWVTEAWDYPRRVSVWGRDGKLVRDYLGGTGYGGTGSYLHLSDPTLGY